MVWLIKPDGMYDTYEPGGDDLDEFFEEEEVTELKHLGSWQGWSFRPSR